MGDRSALHCDVVEALRRVVGESGSSSSLGETGKGVVNRVLSVCKTAPVAAVDAKDSKGES